MFIVLPLKGCDKRRIIDTKNIISVTEHPDGVLVRHRVGKSDAFDHVESTIWEVGQALKANHVCRVEAAPVKQAVAHGPTAEEFKNASPDCHTGS